MKIRTAAVDPDAPGLQFLRHVRPIVPPHTSLLIFVEIAPSTDTMDLSVEGDDDTPGAAEETARFTGGAAEDEYDAVSDVVLGVFRVAEECR